MKRAIVLALSVVLALLVAAPTVATAQDTPEQKTDLSELAAGWWKWAVKKPVHVSPLVGDYTWPEEPRAGSKCAGGSRLGVWNLAGEFALEEDIGGFIGEATRTCKIPAGKPIFFPVFNVLCTNATDPPPLQECATSTTDQLLAGSSFFATVDGQDVPIERVASDGTFTITLPNKNIFEPLLGPGSYVAATDGLWVYLPEGLPKGEHVITFGGTFPVGDNLTFTLDVTYNVIVR